MKKYRIYNNETEMSIEKLLDTACMSCLKDFGNGFDPRAKKLVVEAIKNRKEIIKAIKKSETHTAGRTTGCPEIHCIALVEGKAVCLKSMAILESDTYGMFDQIQFVYEKRYNRFNYMDFHKDYITGLDAIWTNFEYEIV